MADYVQLLRQILTPLVGTVRRIRVALVEDDGTEISPATEAKQDDIKTAVDAVTTKLIAAPSTEAKQDDVITALGSLSTSAKQDLAKAVLDDIQTADEAIQAAVEATLDIAGEIEGPAAHDAAASGNPVQVGGVYRSTDPSLDDGDIGSVRINARGEVLAQLTGSNAAGYESVTVSSSAVGLTSGTYGTNTYALITCEDAQIRFRVDGTSPTVSEGHILNPGDTLELDSNEDIAAFEAIRTGDTDGVIKVSYSGVA